MDLFDLLDMVCGLALFLYGMHVMGEGLSRASGGKLENILEQLTNSRIRAVLLGAAVTAVIQSSSATTVMVVGFVNSGIMKLSQAVGVIMGANIGTTITSWILSLTGIQSGNLLVQLCKPSSFTPVLAIVGVSFILFTRNDKKHNIGTVLVGFTALIPIFGAFIGTAIGAFLILMDSPMQAVWFVIFIIILQQVEGDLIYPRVVGSSVGLPSLWVLLAVTIGGSVWGVLGMLVSVPVCSVLYCLLREIVGTRLTQRGLAEVAAQPEEAPAPPKPKREKKAKPVWKKK